MRHDRDTSGQELREYAFLLRRRKLSIFLITLATVSLALLLSFRQTPIYESTAKVEVRPPTSNQLLQNVPVSSIISLDTEKEIAGSTAVAELVERSLNTGLSVDQLAASVRVSNPANTQILALTYADPDPVISQQRASAFADAYLEFKLLQSQHTFNRVTRAIEEQLTQAQRDLNRAQGKLTAARAGSPAERQAQSEIDVLTGQVAILRSQIANLSTLDINPGVIIDPAVLPDKPARPNHVVNGALALVVGLGLGMSFALIRERLDDRIGSREEFEQVIRAPILAVVPKVANWKQGSRAELIIRSAPEGIIAEAYRTLRTNIQFIARQEDFKILAVASAGMGEGKTTTAANLAVALAQTGRRVLAVSCDTRRPRLHQFFELENRVGLTNMLAGQATLADAAQRCGIESLRVIASGPLTTNPTELLQSEEMTELLGQFRLAADFIVLDTAPVLAVSDALILAPQTDGVILVADASSTSRSALGHVREQLERTGGNVIGGVFNNFDWSQAGYYPSSYYRAYSSYGHQNGDGTGADNLATPAVDH